MPQCQETPGSEQSLGAGGVRAPWGGSTVHPSSRFLLGVGQLAQPDPARGVHGRPGEGGAHSRAEEVKCQGPGAAGLLDSDSEGSRQGGKCREGGGRRAPWISGSSGAEDTRQPGRRGLRCKCRERERPRPNAGEWSEGCPGAWHCRAAVGRGHGAGTSAHRGVAGSPACACPAPGGCAHGLLPAVSSPTFCFLPTRVSFLSLLSVCPPLPPFLP